jgi:hypothetical protein
VRSENRAGKFSFIFTAPRMASVIAGFQYRGEPPHLTSGANT